jgi:hypothetical protein
MSPRSRRVAVLALLVLGAGSLPLFAKTPAHHSPKSATPANEFPPGDGQEIAARSCTMCHSPMLATQQAKDSTGWEKTLSLMEKWGAPVKGAEHDTLRSYLIVHFGTHAERSAE